MSDLQVFTVIGSVISSTLTGVLVCSMLNSRIGTIISIALSVVMFLFFLVVTPYYMCEIYKECGCFVIK
jgi:K+-sensing histidine kinase KdpD